MYFEANIADQDNKTQCKKSTSLLSTFLLLLIVLVYIYIYIYIGSLFLLNYFGLLISSHICKMLQRSNSRMSRKTPKEINISSVSKSKVIFNFCRYIYIYIYRYFSYS